MAHQHSRCSLLEAWVEGRAGEQEEQEELAMMLLCLLYRGQDDLALLYWAQPLVAGEEGEGVEEEVAGNSRKEDVLLQLGWKLHMLSKYCRPGTFVSALCAKVEKIVLQFGFRFKNKVAVTGCVMIRSFQAVLRCTVWWRRCGRSWRGGTPPTPRTWRRWGQGRGWWRWRTCSPACWPPGRRGSV